MKLTRTEAVLLECAIGDLDTRTLCPEYGNTIEIIRALAALEEQIEHRNLKMRVTAEVYIVNEAMRKLEQLYTGTPDGLTKAWHRVAARAIDSLRKKGA